MTGRSAPRTAGGWMRGRWGVAGCAAAGALAALAHPPFGLIPGLLGFAFLLHLLDLGSTERPLRSGLVRGWAGGFGYLAVCTCWIGEPFFIDAAAHAWQAPFALTLTPGLIALIWGGAGLAYRALAPRGVARLLVFASLFALGEWLRGHMLTGFPWDLPGEAWRAGSPMSQGAALVGAYGLSWITLAVAAAPALLFGARRGRAEVAAVGVAALSLVGLWSWGAARLARGAGPAVRAVVRLVQPDLPEPAQVDQAVVDTYLARYLDLTQAPAGPLGRPDVVIWPEGAVPDSFNDYLASTAPGAARMAQALQPGQVLLTGGYRAAARPGGETRYFNTLLALRREPAGLRVTAVYDKHHLVPFGEYLPFERLLAPLGLRQLISVPVGFTPGPRPAPIAPELRIPGAQTVQPLICYEALFPGLAADPQGRRADWIVNVSDDAWFGRAIGPWQHLNLASYRAIEEGLPMVRATPTGVSAVIDAFGRSDGDQLATGRAGVIDAALPSRLDSTPYARWRDGPFWLLVIAGGVSSMTRLRLKRHAKVGYHVNSGMN